jgi:hypothetical protein
MSGAGDRLSNLGSGKRNLQIGNAGSAVFHIVIVNDLAGAT